MSQNGQINLQSDEIGALFKLYDSRISDLYGIKKSMLPKKTIKLDNLLANELISVTKVKSSQMCKITEKGITYVESNREALSKLLEETPRKTKKSASASSVEVLSRLAVIEQKIDLILSAMQPGKHDDVPVIKTNDDLCRFESALKEEYTKLRDRDFLGDGSVWHQELKKIVMDRYQYQDYQYDELLRQLMRKHVGMIVLSQGKDKTWIEIRV